MKASLLITAILATALTARAQTVAENMAPPLIVTEPNGLPFPLAATTFYRANTVYIITTDSIPKAFQLTGQLMVAQGFTIANANKDFYTITSAPKAYRGGYNQTINAAITRNGGLTLVMLSGSYTSAVNDILVRGAGSTQLQMEQRDNAKNTSYMGFDNLVAIANAYPKAKIGYRRR